VLTIRNLSVAYGSVPALHDVNMRVDSGEFVAIVGPNGAGKTTLFNAVSGVVDKSSGCIEFEGRDIGSMAAHARAHLRIAHVPEGRQVFPSLSVIENLKMGAYTAAGRREWGSSLEKIFSSFPVLEERSSQLAGTLSGGEQQMLAIGRGLASAPRLLMLDEPSMGLAPAIADDIFEQILEIHEQADMTVLLVEQRVAEALHFADRGYVLESGRVILEGDHDTLHDNERIREAYLGM
jgi:branched-chain amino acid transport system ATP-binding protein